MRPKNHLSKLSQFIVISLVLPALLVVTTPADAKGPQVKGTTTTGITFEYNGEAPDSAIRNELIPMNFAILRGTDYPSSTAVDVVLTFDSELEVISKFSNSKYSNFSPDSAHISGQTVSWDNLAFSNWHSPYEPQDIIPISFFTRLKRDAEVGKKVGIGVDLFVGSAIVNRYRIPVTVLGDSGGLPESGLSVKVKADKATAKRGEKITYTATLNNESDLRIDDTQVRLIFNSWQKIIPASIKPKYFGDNTSNGYRLDDIRMGAHTERSITFQTTVANDAPVNKTLSLKVQAGGQPQHAKTAAVSVKIGGGAATSDPKITAKDVSALFKAVYGRNPVTGEQKYWVGRLKDKGTKEAMRGAMAFQKAKGKSPKVLAASSRVNISGGGESLTAGTTQRITVSYQAYPYSGGTVRGTLQTDIGSPNVSNISPEPSSQTRDEGQGKIFLNWDYALAPADTMSVSFDVKVPKKGLYGRDSMTVSAYASEGYNNRSWSITEPVATPTPTPVATTLKKTPGLTNSQVTSLFKTVYGRAPVSQELAYWNKRAIEKRTAAALKGAMAFQKAQGKSPKDTTPSSPAAKSTPAIKITEKDFRILTPDGLSTDRADQTITWYSSAALQKKYPAVKIELCPGKDFKGCVILDAVVENDRSHVINMPPVPRIGKWYLHIIGRDSNNGLAPNVAASRLVVLSK